MNNKQEILDDLVQIFFIHSMKLKMLHFQTKKYSIHKSIDKYLDKYNDNFDKFMEIAQGILGKKLQRNNIKIEFNCYIDDIDKIIQDLDKYIDILNNLNNVFKEQSLLNVRDDIVGNIQQLKYLLKFE